MMLENYVSNSDAAACDIHGYGCEDSVFDVLIDMSHQYTSINTHTCMRKNTILPGM